jgi:hypothetical protein
MHNSKMTTIPLSLPRLQALALAHFVKRMSFDTVACFASVAVVTDEGKSEADLVWLALAALRDALAEADAKPPESALPASLVSKVSRLRSRNY